MTALTARRREQPWSSVALLSVLLGLTACASNAATAPAPGTDSPEPVPAPTFGTSGEDPMAIQAGTHVVERSAWSLVDFTVTFPPGWTEQYGHVYSKHPDEDTELGVYAVIVDEIYDDPCEGEGVPTEVGPSVGDLVTALQQQPGTEKRAPVQARLGGRPVTRLDLRVPQGFDLTSCRLWDDGIAGLQVWHSRSADKYFVLGADAVGSVHVLDVGGRRQVFLTQHHDATAPSDLAELQQVLDSIRFGDTTARPGG